MSARPTTHTGPTNPKTQVGLTGLQLRWAQLACRPDKTDQTNDLDEPDDLYGSNLPDDLDEFDQPDNLDRPDRPDDSGSTD